MTRLAPQEPCAFRLAKSTAVLAVLLSVLSVASAQPPTLESRIEQRIAAHQGRVAVAVKHLPSQEMVLIDADKPMPTASLIKVAVMLTAYRQADAGALDLDRMLTLQEEDKVPGSGVLTKHLSPGTQISVRDAIRLMMAFSDNTATNLVVEQVGLDQVNQTMLDLSLPETRMHALVYRRDTSIDPARSKRFGLGSTTAAEMLSLLERIQAGELASEQSTQAMLKHLEACDDTRRIPRLLPKGTTVAHKTGAVSAVRTDAGMIESPGGRIIVVVLTADNEDRRWADENAAELLIAHIARDAYDAFTRKRGPDSSREPRILTQGADGWLVEALQRTLNDRLEPSPELSVDGDFGPATEAAVVAFQEARHLPVTGKVDQATWMALGPLITSDVPITDPDTFDLELAPLSPEDPLQGPPFVTCRGWIVGDPETGEALGGEALDAPRENASTTKLMTAWLVLRTADEDPALLDEVASISARADRTPGSTAGIQTGEQIHVRDLLYGLLLPSGNDAAVALAEHLGSRFDPPAEAPDTTDPLPRFIAEMNRTAESLGMSRTRFENPHGLSAPEHRTTPRDLFRLATTLVRHGGILPYVQARKHIGRIESTSDYVRYELWSNTNRLLNTEGYLGMKTGTTRPAGACLVSLSRRGERQLIAVVLGSTSSDARYVDTRNLFRWAWQQ